MITAASRVSDVAALSKALSCLLARISPLGFWSDFQEDWNPIITTITSDLLTSCGLAPDEPWYIRFGDGYVCCRLTKTFGWLNDQIGSDGHFGTDVWDAARLGLLIEREQLAFLFPSYARLKDYILHSVSSSTLLNSNSSWAGPGFLAATVEYLDRMEMRAEADSVLSQLVNCQEDDGSWVGIRSPDGHPAISPVWHTAQAILTLARRSRVQYRHQIDKAVNWLKHTQLEAGCWAGVQEYVIYFTAYAVLALLKSEIPDRTTIQRAVAYLKSQLGSDGRCSDMGGTLMFAIALREFVGDRFEHELTLIDFVLAKNMATRAEHAEGAARAAQEDCASATVKLQAYEKRYADADIVISKKQLFAICIVSLLITTVGTVVGVFALLAVLGNPTSNIPAGLPQTAPAISGAQTRPVGG